MPKKLGAILLMLMVLMVGCQGESQELPTWVSIPASGPEVVEQNQPSPEPTLTPTATERYVRTGPTLPPTFTPTPTATTPPTETSTPTVEGFSSSGTIYYIYNGDTIEASTGDGTRQETLLHFGPDRPITELTISPDGEMLALVAPATGSPSEVWVMNRDGTYVQKVTCLGLEHIRSLAFSPNSERIAFIGAQTLDGPEDIYSASWIGSNNCPEGNDQKMLLERNSENLGDVIYDTRAERLFFSDGPIYTLELNTGRVFTNLTETAGIGPDFAFAINPANPDMLSYLQDANRITNLTDGSLFAILPRAIDILAPQAFTHETLTRHYAWSPDGTRIAVSSPNSVSIYRVETRTATGIVSNTTFTPMAIFAPTGERVAYIDADPANPEQQQIFIIEADGTDQVQLTAYESGTISNMLWVNGGW